MAASGVWMSLDQSLSLEASEIAIEGAAVRNGMKMAANVIRSKESVNLREDLQDFQFRQFRNQKGLKVNLSTGLLGTHMLVYDN